MNLASASLTIIALLLAEPAVSQSIPPYVAAAVEDSDRPQEDRQRDTNRKPAEVIAFAGFKPGDKVADFMPGRGYFTRIVCKLVGDAGHVYSISIPRSAPASDPSSAALDTTCNNVSVIELHNRKRYAPELYSRDNDPGVVYEYWEHIPAAENFVVSEPLDLIWIGDAYHELHNAEFGSPNLQLVNRALFKALKPGGLLIIEDNVSVAGNEARDTASLHRIDPALVKREVTAAGFEFVGESGVLRNPQDAHTSRAPELHDTTDRFLFKFRKP